MKLIHDSDLEIAKLMRNLSVMLDAHVRRLERAEIVTGGQAYVMWIIAEGTYGWKDVRGQSKGGSGI